MERSDKADNATRYSADAFAHALYLYRVLLLELLARSTKTLSYSVSRCTIYQASKSCQLVNHVHIGDGLSKRGRRIKMQHYWTLLSWPLKFSRGKGQEESKQSKLIRNKAEKSIYNLVDEAPRNHRDNLLC